MTIIDELKRTAIFVAYCLAQVLVFNHIHLFDCATVLLYVYFVVMLPWHYPQWASLLWSFFLGLSIDIFNNTPGMAAASLTLVAFLQPYLLVLFVPREAPENLVPSAANMGFSKFLTFSSLLVFIYCLAFFTIEAFTFFNWQQWFLNVVGSTLLTMIILLSLESIRK